MSETEAEELERLVRRLVDRAEMAWFRNTDRVGEPPTLADTATPEAMEPEACARWSRDQMALSAWPFAVVAFWVAVRDLERIAPHFLHCSGTGSDPLRQGAGTLLRSAVGFRPELLAEPEPGAALVQALSAAAGLTARGYLGGGERLESIPAAEWQGLELTDTPADAPERVRALAVDACAFRRGRGGFWAGLTFDRATVLSVFRPGDRSAAEETASAWKVKPGEQIKGWLGRPETVAEAKRRQGADPKRPKRSLNTHLAEMAVESEAAFKRATISRYRRG